MTYIGRFAPSPTGQLHFGSLLAAVASFVDAKAHNGQWLLRIDDIDKPREVAGSSNAIIEALQAHGLIWDGAIMYQSLRTQHYQTALAQLQDAGFCYRCDCSRSRLNGQAYDGHCRTHGGAVNSQYAIRIRAEDKDIQFHDTWQGLITENIAQQHGDFVIWRKDDLCAYQLAVVVDDHAMGINHVIRGSDLIDSTARQLRLYQALDLPAPQYGHLPVLLNHERQKLSKQSYAEAIQSNSASTNLRRILIVLGQLTPPATVNTPSQILRFACEHWRPRAVPQHDIVWPD